MRRLRPDRRFIIAALVTAVLTACVHRGAPGVAVRSLQADIVFGVPAPQPATPPGIAAPPGLVGDLGPPITPPVSVPHSRVTLPPPPPVACPTASENASAATAAPVTVKAPPEPGSYRWKVAQVDARGNKRAGLFTRTISNVSKITQTPNPESATGSPPFTSTFTYDQTSLMADGTKQVVTYQVKTNAISASADAEVSTAPVQAGEPDRGLALVKVVDYDAAGKQTRTFSPTPAVLLLPLDVISNQTFQAVGVDPTGATLVNNGTVKSRRTVDACGDLVDGWEVQSSETYTDAAGNSTASAYDYYVATQLGGILSFEQTAPPSSGTAAAGSVTGTTTDLTLGQLHPSPLPAGSG